MRKLIFFLSFILSVGSCAKNPPNKKGDNHSEDTASPLNGIMKKELRSFIHYVEVEEERNPRNHRAVYEVLLDNYQDTCYMTLYFDYYYNTERFDFYTYLDEKLVLYMKYNDTLCNLDFVDTSKLILFRDSIPKYKDIKAISMDYAPMKRLFKIHSSDSLEIIFTGRY